jgi:hypothetical protein
MGRWRGFLDSLATTGGHIFVLLFLVMMGTGVLLVSDTRGWMKGAEVGAGMEGLALGALLMMYKSSGTNAEQVARAGQPYQPPQPPADALKPPIVVGDQPLPPSTLDGQATHPDTTKEPA